MVPGGRQESAFESDAAGAAKSDCVALIPLSPTASSSRGVWWRWSPDAAFVAQLMACAKQLPQTRGLRRASPADAESAYRTHQIPANDVGRRMRQVV